MDGFEEKLEKILSSPETMSRIAEQAEKSVDFKASFYNTDFRIKNSMDAISHSVCGMSMDIGAKAIVVCSISGITARMVSRFRCPVDIIGMTTDEGAWRKLNMSWGVIPVLNEELNSEDVLYYKALNEAKALKGLKRGDNVVITGGRINGHPGNTNTIKLETV